MVPDTNGFLTAVRGDLVVARCEQQPAIEARLWLLLADYHQTQGCYTARAQAEWQALVSLRRCGDWARGVDLLCRLATTLHGLGRSCEAYPLLQEAANLIHSLSDAEQIARRWVTITMTAHLLDAPALVITYGVQARAVCQAQGDPQSELEIIQQLGAAYRATRQWEAATNCLIQSVILAEVINAPGMAAQWLYDLGGLALQQAHPDHACRYFQAARRVFRALADPVGEGRVLLALGQGWLRCGEQAQALACWRRSQDLLSTQPIQDHNLPAIYLSSLRLRLGAEGFEQVWTTSQTIYQHLILEADSASE